ncbi:hypothetical protein pb186bvf_016089 [Paramecium bursaria]
MGCMQQKKSQKYVISNFMNQRSRNQSSNKQYDSSNRPSSTSQLDYQTTFKLNLIQDLMRNRGSKQVSSRSLSKKKLEVYCPVQRKMKKLTISSIKTDQIKVFKGVSESADGFPQPQIIRKRSYSEVKY